MKNIKKKFYIILFMFVAMIIINTKSSYANTLSNLISAYKSGNPSASTSNSYNLNYSNTIANSGENFYCIARGRGSITTGSTDYRIMSCFKIDKNGIEYFIEQDHSYAMYNKNWDEIKNEEDFFGKNNITKKMYYVLGIGNNSYYEGDIELNNGNKVSQKQLAIWMYIDDFLKLYDYNTKGLIYYNGGIERI